MRVAYIPSNLDGAGFYRCMGPARELARRGHFAATVPGDATTNGFWTNIAWDVGRIPEMEPDVVVMQMPLDSITPPLIDRLQADGVRVVVELDDDYTCLPGWNPAFKATSPLLPENRDRNRQHLFEAVRRADAISVSTPALAESYGRLNPNVTVVRNFLDWRMWADVTQQSEVQRRRIRVGWMGWLDWRASDLEVIKPWLGGWLRDHPDVEFVAAGDPTVHDFLDVPVAQRVSTARLPFSMVPRVQGDRFLRELADITACMDIGLVPLAAHRFNEGKSHLKGMELAACGIPCVASPTESYRDYWLAKVEPPGLVAEDAGDWVAALDVLVGDDGLRRRMGRCARQQAAQHTIQEHVNEWERFFTAVVDQGGSGRGNSRTGSGRHVVEGVAAA